jgi:hypothetical protein
MNVQNEKLLNPKPGDPNGYVTKDGMWAAVPYGKKFMILHNGVQIQVLNNYTTAKTYILKQVKALKKSSSSLDQFL